MVKNAMAAAERSGSTFAEAVAGMPELAALLPADDIAGLAVPENYLGVADAFRQRLIASATNARHQESADTHVIRADDVRQSVLPARGR